MADSTQYARYNGLAGNATIVSGNLTDTGTDGIVITGGTGAVLGTGTQIAQHVADASHNGYLSSADWTTFNGKGIVNSVSVTSANGFAGTSSGGATPALTLSTTITGLLQGNGTAISAATTGSLTDAGTDGITVGNGSGAVLGSGTTISQHVADTTHNGYLSSTDWNTFNGKGSGTVTAVSVASSNGFAGSSSGGATPALTLSTSITGIIKGNGTAISAATAGTDYSAGTNALATGILKSTTTTGALTIAVAGDFPTLNQNTSGSAASLSATLAIASGGTGQTSAGAAFGALSPLTTKGDVLGFSTVNARVPVGGDNTVLTADSSQTLGVKWANPTISLTAPTVQKFTSGTGTYTSPAGVLYVRIIAVGGGGGGAGSGTASSSSNGGAGGNTTFATSVVVANGGAGGVWSGLTNAAGGTASLGSGAAGIAVSGGSGGGGNYSGSLTTDYGQGGNGGNSGLGGGAGMGGAATLGGPGATGTGGGGAGGGFGTTALCYSGDGGGAGGYCDAIVTTGFSGGIAYAVGGAGTQGGAGTSGVHGGAGGSGSLTVFEYYQ